ncbi:hypothetical protein PGT21_008941 [Puccinia graminis f. sp. tritici]|uniref:Uncharacterized protein n=2 Tax=Puccinia graminis f. sp. tritici TaxID=56615 RepID=E3KFX4_PUCGT|nr:uncharacterized protein PGTG_09090 [Puccinia graminis f. sp. tritici CRL 75-36-700-3]EFP83137.2 hypothetical protein PGTG_09090 [Puccinia graminis f. sp. tritici CRL 75-36-700-3]KAA1089170.1 hypothetical protein PGT21_008941 [Puccinia graminis f. sp. tritici]
MEPESSTMGLNAPKPNLTEQQRIVQKGDLLVERFWRISEDYHPDEYDEKRPDPTASQALPDIEQVNLKKQSMDRLHSILLPLLGRQIVDLSKLSDPIKIRREPDATFELMFNKLAELEPTLEQLRSEYYVLFPEKIDTPYPYDNNDQHLEEFKTFRVRSLGDRLMVDAILNAISVIDESRELLEQMNLCIKRHRRYRKIDIDRCRKNILESTADTLEGIKTTKGWLRGSEFELIQHHWPTQIRVFDDTLDTLSTLIDPPTNTNEPNPTTQPEQPERNHLSEPVLQMARLSRPIIKLTRLFFHKISRRVINMKQLPVSVGMSSFVLKDLSDSADEAGRIFQRLVKLLREVDNNEHEDDEAISSPFTKISSILECSFETYLFYVLLYLVPRLPETGSFPTQDSFNDWCITWHNLFCLAIENFEDAASMLDNPH